jgi:streptogramin lyase
MPRWILYLALMPLTLTTVSLAEDQTPIFTVKTIAGSEADGDGGPAANATFGGIQSIVVDHRGVLYVAERKYHRVRMIDSNGVVSTVAGTGQPGCGPDAGKGPAIALSSPTAVAVDTIGTVYIADTGNARVRKLDRDGLLTTVVGGGSFPADANADGSPAILLKLRSPVAVLPDVHGGVYVADSIANRVYYVDRAGVLTTIAGAIATSPGIPGQLAIAAPIVHPTGLANDPNGGLIIAENGMCRYRRVYQRLISNYPADYAVVGFCPTGILIDTSTNTSYYLDSSAGVVFQRPLVGESTKLAGDIRALTVDRRGIVSFSTETSIVRSDGTPVAGTGAVVTDMATAMPEKASSTRFQTPYAIVRMPDGALVVSEEEAHRIRRISSDGTVTLFAGSGQAGYCGDGSIAAEACLNRPRGMALDRWGNLFIADSGNHAVRVVTPLGRIYTVAGDGHPGSGLDSGPAIRSVLTSPSGVAINSAGELLIADTGNGVIRRLGVSGILFSLTHAYEWQTLKSPIAVSVAKDGSVFVIDEAQRCIIAEAADGRMTVITDVQFVSPSAVAVGTTGQVWIADREVNGVFLYDGRRIAKVAGNGRGEFSGDDGEALSASVVLR